MQFLKKFKNADKYVKLAVIVIAIGIIIRFALVSMYHVSGDACWHLSISRFMAENLKIPLLEPLGREVFWEPPAFHIIAAAFFQIFSIFGSKAGDLGMKLISPIFGSLSLILTFVILDKIFGKKIAFYSLIFVTFLPISIFYSVIAYTESLMTFFVLLAIYFTMKNWYILGGVAFGISLLTKYNALFSLPLIMYFMYKGYKTKREFLQKFFIFGVITSIIFAPWMIRNFIHLGNPLWPFFTSVFGGLVSAETLQGTSFSTLFYASNLLTLYLGVFGVPEGAFQNLFFFNIPSIEILLGFWLAGTILFLVPIFAYFIKRDKKSNASTIALLLVIPHLLLIMLYILNTTIAYSRLLIPAIPLFSVVWGLGFSSIISRFSRFKNIIFFVLIGVIIGFVAVEFVKTPLAASAWNFYEEDFAWIRENTEKGSVILAGGQCLSYNLNRFTLDPAVEDIGKTDYAWINQNFNLDPHVILDKQKLKTIQSENYKEVYSNDKTGTVIYRTTQ